MGLQATGLIALALLVGREGTLDESQKLGEMRCFRQQVKGKEQRAKGKTKKRSISSDYCRGIPVRPITAAIGFTSQVKSPGRLFKQSKQSTPNMIF